MDPPGGGARKLTDERDVLRNLVCGEACARPCAHLGDIECANYLHKLMAVASAVAAALPLIPHLLNPDRWLLWLGVLFVLSVYFFPSGIVGKLREMERR
jgi:hypothetical protein